MDITLDCIPCFLRQGLEAARSVTDDEAIHERIVRDILALTARLDLSQPPPRVGQAIHRRLRELTGVSDPYGEAKARFNELAMRLLPDLRAEVVRDADPLTAAAKVAIAANVIDLGVDGSLSEQSVRAALAESLRTPVHGDWAEFRRISTGANRILYLADNAGEIAIDRLLVEQLGPGRVTLAVRGSAVINDATREDARAVGLTDLVEVIDNGSDAPGTLLDDCSPAFREAFFGADLIIAKGQGNFETLGDANAPIRFLLKVKCPVIARHVGLPAGTHALLGRRQALESEP